jgi:3-hydroxybutyryl-CoA dehydrogenase
MSPDSIGTVGVVGCGLMGSGIAQVCAAAGFPTVVCELDKDALTHAMARLERTVRRGVERGKLTEGEAAGLLDRLTQTTALADLADCDLVIEAVTETLDAKRAVFAELDAGCGDGTIFASNTSSLSITEMAVATQRPDRFVGLHFFNPVPVMALVEVVHTLLSAEEVVAAATTFGERLGKTPVLVKDRTGFVVNRLLVPYLLEAIRALEEGLASAEDIDRAMQLGCGYPMGPFALLDYVGLDTTLYIAGIMYDEFRQPQHAAPPLLKRMVLAGHLGRKSGRGFYRYND